MSKTKTMPITEVRVNLGAVVERVRTNNERVTLEKGGIPVAMLVSIDELEDLQDALELLAAREENKSEPLLDWKKIRAEYV